MALIGIDLGTTNSLVTAYKDGEIISIPNSLGKIMTKSAVSFKENGEVLVGDSARERLISHSDFTVAYFKQFMGTDHEYFLNNKSWKAHNISAILLKQLKEDAEKFLGEKVEEAIISVPAYFNDNQRSATKIAASLAGLKANRLINEPSAAALYYRQLKDKKEGKFLVIDFGGGTLDVSVVDCFEEIVEILAISGDNQLGGKDIDKLIVNYVLNKLELEEDSLSQSEKASLYRSAEDGKINLLEKDLVWIGFGEKFIALNNEILANLCNPLFKRIKEVIVNAVKLSKISISEITDIVLVGGSCSLKVFVDYLEAVFGIRPETSKEAEHMVALGLGLCCGIKNKTIKDVFMTDVCPFSLGTGIYNRANVNRPKMATLISRCSILPSSCTQTFYTVYDGQTEVVCGIYQGEHLHVDENLKLGELKMQVPPAPAGSAQIILTFTYTIDGILQVEAKATGGDNKETLIVNPNLSLSTEELKEKINEIEKIKLIEDEENNFLLSKLERLYFQSLDDKREEISNLYTEFSCRMNNGKRVEQKKLRDAIKLEIEKLEENLTTSLKMNE